MQRCFRTMDSAPVQRERGGNKLRSVTFQHHLFWTAPTVRLVKMTKDQTGREALGMKAKIMRHTTSLQSQKREMIEDIALFVKMIHMVIR